MDEMVTFDLPAIFDYISEQTQQENIAYIGHSQGNWYCTVLVIQCITYR